MRVSIWSIPGSDDHLATPWGHLAFLVGKKAEYKDPEILYKGHSGDHFVQGLDVPGTNLYTTICSPCMLLNIQQLAFKKCYACHFPIITVTLFNINIFYLVRMEGRERISK